MKALLFTLAGLFITLVSLAQKDGEIISTTSVIYPAYKNIKGISSYYDRDTYEKAIADKAFKTEKITYYSDGLKVIAFLATPKVLLPKKKYPVIIFNRGSYTRNDIAFVHAPLFQKLVAQGFIVIAPALRESEGGEGKDELGGKDLHDIWNILPFVNSNIHMDTANLFMYGESRGAVMSLQVLKDGFPVKAAATVGAFSDFGLFVKENPSIEGLCRQIWPDYEENKDSIFLKRSAIKWANQINVPLLAMAGSEDQSVNPHHSIRLADQLNSYHKDFQLLILNKGNHVLSGASAARRDAEIINWFRQH